LKKYIKDKLACSNLKKNKEKLYAFNFSEQPNWFNALWMKKKTIYA